MNLTKPLHDDVRASVDVEAYSKSEVALEESTKQKVRRLAAHCAAYRGSVPKLAYRQLATTLIPLALLIAGMFMTVRTNYLITLLLAIPAGGLLVRVFIIQHDCGHGSFFPNRSVNDFVGRLMSVLTMAPYGLWKREHALHHATSGNLEKRGVGDIDTMTVAEYMSLPLLGKLRYRLYRNPLFLFGIGVPLYFVFIQRSPWLHGLAARDAWKSVMGLNLGLAAFYSPFVYFFGFWDTLFVVWPMVHLASAAGGWLFFVQHQFEETRWDHAGEWDFQVAALLGSSFYDLPKVLNWFTGNIGLHHIHHLNSMIPNYRLQDCLNASPELKKLNHLTLWESFKCSRLKLWDEAERRLIGFNELPRAA